MYTIRARRILHTKSTEEFALVVEVADSTISCLDHSLIDPRCWIALFRLIIYAAVRDNSTVYYNNKLMWHHIEIDDLGVLSSSSRI